MFESFFPKPKFFLITLLLWLSFVIGIYYSVGQTLGELIGFQFSDEGAPTVIGLGYFVTPEDPLPRKVRGGRGRGLA